MRDKNKLRKNYQTWRKKVKRQGQRVITVWLEPETVKMLDELIGGRKKVTKDIINTAVKSLYEKETQKPKKEDKMKLKVWDQTQPETCYYLKLEESELEDGAVFLLLVDQIGRQVHNGKILKIAPGKPIQRFSGLKQGIFPLDEMGKVGFE